MAEISIHRAQISIESEMPHNALAVRLNLGEGTKLVMFIADVEQWWALRNALPKGDDYTLSATPYGAGFLRGEEADEYALRFYQDAVAKRNAVENNQREVA